MTCKHHDGFCLWPSQYTEHSVKSSPWKNGGGDVVKEVADACRRGGIRFGIYLSPWDRHEPTYGDSPAYNEYFKNQLRELLTGYGDIFCVWFDGACGEGPNGKRQVYDWDAYYALIRELQPGAAISVCGPDIRWCGNEAGHCRESEWSVVPASLRDNEKIQENSQQEDDGEFAKRYSSEDEDLGSRDVVLKEKELIWYPAEVNTSIRPGWFYHASQDDQVKPLEELIKVYYGSVGGNATFLLNIPPDTRGLFHENDVRRLQELGEWIRGTFRTNLAAAPRWRRAKRWQGMKPYTRWTATGIRSGLRKRERKRLGLTVDLGAEQTFDHVVLQEYRYSQRVERFVLEYMAGGEWIKAYDGTVIGYKRICRFPAVTSRYVRLTITQSRWWPNISAFEVYRGDRNA